jgi:hypothetical protein
MISNLQIFLWCVVILEICFQNMLMLKRRHVRGSINRRGWGILLGLVWEVAISHLDWSKVNG